MEYKIVTFPEDKSVDTIDWEVAESTQAGIVLAFDGDMLLGSIQYNLEYGYSLNVSVGGLECFKGYTTDDSLKDIYYRIKKEYPNIVFKFYTVNEYISDSGK